MKNFKKLLTLVAVGAFTIHSTNSKADTESALATITVIQAVDLVKNTDLNFPEAAQGEPTYTVAPSDPEAATFSVSGAADQSINTSIDESSIEMITGLGDSAEKKIIVNSFVHNAPAQLDALGTASFGVGASRAALLANQAPGSYQATFNVTVSYQ